MNAANRARGRFSLMRLLGVAVLAALIVPLLMTTFPSAAHADNEDERDNYSLYQLASNASSYFGEKNSPDGGDGLHEEWDAITSSPATGGDMLGYADPEFSVGNVIGWLFAEATGSTQTITFDTLRTSGGEDGNTYAGMLDYAHFGAANADLGLDTMSSGIGGQIVSMIGGGAIWLLYLLALAVGTVFFLIIQVLKAINPFMWFYQAVAGVADSGGNTNGSHQQELADGMTRGDAGGGALAGLQHWIASWYGLLQSIAWEALVPLFIGFLIIGLVLFKKMDRGSAIKKLIIRVVFIGVGLPLLGSMYTGVLDKFDDSLLGQHAGPTRVVLSTYVDFEAWMMNDRLAIPDQASISWEDGQAGSESMMSVRNSALAVNAEANREFSGISIGTKTSDAEAAWRAGTVDVGGSAGDDVQAVFSTFGILNRYISGQITSASDFESGIKSAITDLDVADGDKKEWFVDDKSYGDVEGFGEQGGPAPNEHPVLAVNGQGLTSSNPGGSSTTFTTPGNKQGCGFSVLDADGNLASCNLSALSAYNYLNTGFGSDSLTMYSSNNVTSGLTREDHMAVSQVGTGPAKFMYWQNAATVLGCIALLGFWYAIGMLAGAVKRTFSLVAAIPFATLGALSAIAKVVVYSVALILEVIVTLFIYQFVSEFLISIPDIIAGPLSSLMDPNGLFGSPALGGIVVVLLTIVSSLVIVGVTVALLRVRKVVLQAMDEVFTKLVDKFLETSTPSKANKAGAMPSPAHALGTGAGAAAGQKLASGLGGKLSGGSKLPKTGGDAGGGKNASTNAGGLNGQQSLPAAGQTLAIGPGGRDGSQVGEAPRGGSQDDRAIKGSDARALPADSNGGTDEARGGPLQLTSGKAGSSRSDKETAQSLSSKGGLTNLGYSTGEQPGSRGRTNGQSNHSESAQSGTNGRGHSSPSGKSGGQTSFGLGGAQGTSGMKQLGQGSSSQPSAESAERASNGRKAIASGSNSTHFGIGGQSAPASSGQDGQQPKGARFVAGMPGTGGATQLSQDHAGTPGHSAAPGSRTTHPIPEHDPWTAQAPASSRRRAVTDPAQQGQPKPAGQRPQQGQRREQVDRSIASGSAQRPPGSVAPTQPAPKSGRGAAPAKPRAGRPVPSPVINHKREPKE